jgi:hypothetical protein
MHPMRLQLPTIATRGDTGSESSPGDEIIALPLGHQWFKVEQLEHP